MNPIPESSWGNKFPLVGEGTSADAKQKLALLENMFSLEAFEEDFEFYEFDVSDPEDICLESFLGNPHVSLKENEEKIKEVDRGERGVVARRKGRNDLFTSQKHASLLRQAQERGGIKLKSWDKNTKKETIEIIENPNIILFTPEQYAKIKNAAIHSLKSLSRELKAHEEKMKELEEGKKKFPLLGRLHLPRQEASRFVKDALKNLAYQNFLSRRKRESRLQQLKEEQKAQEDRDIRKRKIKKEDKRFELRKQRHERDEKLKALEKGEEV